jgi:hypothetical protein
MNQKVSDENSLKIGQDLPLLSSKKNINKISQTSWNSEKIIS